VNNKAIDNNPNIDSNSNKSTIQTRQKSIKHKEIKASKPENKSVTNQENSS
jgi:hypothetical protein